MRVTTQMLNRSAARAGVPLQQGGLMNYINQSGNSPRDILSSVNAKQTDSASRAKYEKQGKSADELLKQLKNFAEHSELFETGEDGKVNEDAYKGAERFVGQYNSLLSALDRNPESLDIFYGQSLKELVSTHKDLLSEVGITAGKDGKLSVDKNKMKEAGSEKLKNLFGVKSGFLTKMQFIASRVADRAEANLESTSANYSSKGNMNYYSANRYDFRG